MLRRLAIIGVALLFQASPSSQTQPVGAAGSSNAKPGSFDQEIQRHAQQMIDEGRKIFRFDTFGDEAFWGDELRPSPGPSSGGSALGCRQPRLSSSV